MRAYHGDVAVKEKYLRRARLQRMIQQALEVGTIVVNQESGEAFGRRGQRLGCRNAAGYLVSTLHLNGERRQVKLHQVVYLSCHRRIHVGTVIDHINGSKSDNRLCNLRAVSAAENARNRRTYRGEGNPAAKISREIAAHIRGCSPALSYKKIAAQFGVSATLVAKIVRRELWI